MAKGQSHSATTTTRKKHQKKAKKAEDLPGQSNVKKEKKNKKEPRPKVFIAPKKPAPVQIDPLETFGLVHQLSPELIVILRKLGKKDEVTKAKALEELQSQYVDQCQTQGYDSRLLSSLITMVPAWMHHFPSLFLHRSKRIRALSAALQSSFLRLDSMHDAIFSFLRDVATRDQLEDVLGAWCLAAHDVDRAVAFQASESWKSAVSHPQGVNLQQNLPSLLSFIQRALLDPLALYLYFNPVQTQVADNIPNPHAPRHISASVAKRELTESSSWSRGELEEETEQDRKARLRVGAMGALKWILDICTSIANFEFPENVIELLSSSAVWSSLHNAEKSSFAEVECFGYKQPAVRRSAWLLLHSLLKFHKDVVPSLLSVLSVAVLLSAWLESDTLVQSTMWQPLLLFLKGFPSAWEHATLFKRHQDELDSDDGESETTLQIQLSVYREFLRFLESGCAGSPSQGYPVVVVILSTIPPSILGAPVVPQNTPLINLFASFWVALDSRALSALDRVSASTAFLSAVLECTVFIARRFLGEGADLASSAYCCEDSTEAAERLVTEQMHRVWQEAFSMRLNVEEPVIGKLLAQHLKLLRSWNEAICSSSWRSLVSSVRSKLQTGSTMPSLVTVVLMEFERQFQAEPELQESTASLISEIIEFALAQWEDTLRDGADGPAMTLTKVIDAFGDHIFRKPDLASRTDDLVTHNASRLLLAAPSLLLSYLAHRNSEEQCQQLWNIILFSVANQPETAQTVLAPMLNAVQHGPSQDTFPPSSGQLDDMVINAVSSILQPFPENAQLSFVQSIMRVPRSFVSPKGLQSALGKIVSEFSLLVDHALRGVGVQLQRFTSIMDLVNIAFDPQSFPLAAVDLAGSLLPDIVALAYFLPRCYDTALPEQAFVASQHYWNSWLRHAPADVKHVVLPLVKDLLRSLLCDTEYQLPVEYVLQVISDGCPGLDIDFNDIFPPREEFDAMLDELPSDALHGSLAVLDPTLPIKSTVPDLASTSVGFDNCGYSTYARVVSAVSSVFTKDRRQAKENTWALRHMIALSLYVDDFLLAQSVRNPVFQELALKSSDLPELPRAVHQTMIYLLASSVDEGWRMAIVEDAISGRYSGSPDSSSGFVLDTISRCVSRRTTRESRIMRVVLQHILRNADTAEAEKWMILARMLEKHAPHACISIMSIVTNIAPHLPRLVQFRNEFAAGLLGVSQSAVNSAGLVLLQKLAATAPSPTSEVEFLPQQRAVNLMKTCRMWSLSIDDMDEEVEGVMLLIFAHVVPVLQTVPGAHWDFLFDVIETNLKACESPDDSDLVMLARTLDLILYIEEFAASSVSLEENWSQRRKAVTLVVGDIVAQQNDSVGTFLPRSTCRRLALQFLLDRPAFFLNGHSLSNMCHLLLDPLPDVQILAYQLLQHAARTRTEDLVIEAGLDTDATFKAELPSNLIEIIQKDHQLGDDPGRNEQGLLFSWLLSWMLVFDSFSNASLKVKSHYVDQLRRLDIVPAHFIPTVFHLLQLYEGSLRTFKLDIWAVDEFCIQYSEPNSLLSNRLLAAHLYYQALSTIPSIIRSWLNDCKDKQLSSTVIAYTSQHFSPMIIKSELSRVKSPEGTAELADENLTIKVLSTVNEVTASYLVDEHLLEIGLKLPADWPLHNIELREKRVAVDTLRWRAWMLGVQQIFWSQNGHIVDGLSLFKKNVSLHFQGQAECAICYSIINVTDFSLPKKPCKTCKNRFHLACLYKWFSTSHSSSCPLCRSDFI